MISAKARAYALWYSLTRPHPAWEGRWWASVDRGQTENGAAAHAAGGPIVRSGASLAQEWVQEPEQVRLIPSGGLALALDPDLQAGVLLQEIEC